MEREANAKKLVNVLYSAAVLMGVSAGVELYTYQDIQNKKIVAIIGKTDNEVAQANKKEQERAKGALNLALFTASAGVGTVFIARRLDSRLTPK